MFTLNKKEIIALKNILNVNVIRDVQSTMCKDIFQSDCIYFLLNNNQIVYIGETTNLMQRISEHYKTNKVFDSFNYAVFKGSVLERKERESFLIERYFPIYNVQKNQYYLKSAIKDYSCYLSSVYNYTLDFRIFKQKEIIHTSKNKHYGKDNNQYKDLITSINAIEYFYNNIALESCVKLNLYSNNTDLLRVVNRNFLTRWEQKDFKTIKGKLIHNHIFWKKLLVLINKYNITFSNPIAYD